MDIAAAHAPVARAAPVAAAAVLVVLQAVGGDAGAIGGQHAPHFRQALAQFDLRGIQAHGALEQAVGQVGQVFLVARDAQIEIDLVVIGRDIRVGYGPVFTVAVARGGFEIVIREAQRQAAPDVGLAAQAARAHPGVLGAGVGMVLLVDHDVLGVIGAVAVLDVRIDMLVRRSLGVGRLADGVFIGRRGRANRAACRRGGGGRKATPSSSVLC